MSGYRRVNYYELCRLCTSSEGSKMNIFLEEGRRRQLQTKIQTYLPVQVLEEDSLPKIVCLDCIKKLENYIEFREAVVNAEGMLESYFTSLRFSEDFLKEAKVYVKSTKEEKLDINEEEIIEDEPLNSVEKIVSTGTQIITDQTQSHPQVLVSNLNASDLQIISGVQARVQQYKCAMQMQAGNVSAAVVEATAETHYSYQQQTPQQLPSQQNQTQNQIVEQQQQQSQPQQTQVQVQNQIQSQNQISQQQVQTLRQLSQQPSNQASQVNQQQTHINQEQQNQTQITQQLQQLQRQQREQFEKQRQMHQLDKQQHVHVTTTQEQQPTEVHRSNIILKTEEVSDQQTLQTESQKNDAVVVNQNQQAFTTVQATPEVFLSLGFKDALAAQVTRDDSKELKDFVKGSENAISRTSISHISEFLRIRPNNEQPSQLVTVNPQAISQTTTRQLACCECGKIFSSINQMTGHDCTSTLLNEVTEVNAGGGATVKKDESPTNINSNGSNNGSSPFSCDVCNKPFKRKEHLFQHRKLHTGERPYVCTTCAKAFSRKEHLVRHLVSHTGQKMHECEVCGKSFSRKDNLHKHRKTHGMSGPYICETCGKSFVVKHYYHMHLTTHAPAAVDGLNCIQDPLPYKCDICHKAFSVKQYLTTHKLRHRPKTNSSQSNNPVNDQQQQQQTQQATSTQELTVTRDITSVSMSNGTGHTGNASVIEIQGVVDRADQQQNQQGDTFTSSHYQGNVSQFQ